MEKISQKKSMQLGQVYANFERLDVTSDAWKDSADLSVTWLNSESFCLVQQSMLNLNGVGYGSKEFNGDLQNATELGGAQLSLAEQNEAHR